jgi:hypothetical protein
MKRIVWLLLLISITGGRTFAQDPIFGLGICTSGIPGFSPTSPDNTDTPRTETSMSDSSWQAFLPRFEEGLQRFVNGDPTLWKQHAWQGEAATLMGGWGAYEKGWTLVGPRYDWAAARFQASNGYVQVEYLSWDVGKDLAYTVSIERSQVRLVGEEQPAPMALRVTQLFRKDGKDWKLVHRQANPLTGSTAPAEVLQK